MGLWERGQFCWKPLPPGRGAPFQGGSKEGSEEGRKGSPRADLEGRVISLTIIENPVEPLFLVLSLLWRTGDRSACQAPGWGSWKSRTSWKDPLQQ